MTQLDPVLTQIAAGAAQGPDAFDGDPVEARARLAAAITSAPDEASRAAAGTPEDRTVHQDGLDVALRITRPKTEAPDAIVVFLHGGGYALGSAALADDISSRLAVELNATVVAVDYRLAPEHPFPAAFEDSVAAVRWVAAHRDQLATPETPVVLVGESAGANIAAAVALETAEHLTAQILVVPGPDISALRDVAEVPGSMLTVASLHRIVEIAFRNDWEQAATYPASALASPRLADSPPTLIALAGYDPTAPVGRVFADQLQATGVAVTVLELDDMFHPFFGFAHISPGAAQAFTRICDQTRALLSTV